MTKDGYFQPDFVKDIPTNFTLEFEIFTRYRSNNILEYQFYILPSANPKSDLSEEYLNNYFQFKWLGCEGSSSFYVVEKGETVNKNEGFTVKDLMCKGDNKDEPTSVKFSIWRQESRLRIYVNENKILDIPQAFDSKSKYNVFKMGPKYMNFSENENKDEFMVSNIRYAVGAPDTRNKLITEGKLVTRGILFDVNSDVIKPSSYGVLKEIATTLKENPTVTIKIVGHTDSDGEATSNLTLSQNRALAVKNFLTSEFKIAETRMQTDGKGESVPSDSNKTSIGKANNRRVEFIKL
jgi:outer membrane protein OmpA-like peptidoglycan-associated protein